MHACQNQKRTSSSPFSLQQFLWAKSLPQTILWQVESVGFCCADETAKRMMRPRTLGSSVPGWWVNQHRSIFCSQHASVEPFSIAGCLRCFPWVRRGPFSALLKWGHPLICIHGLKIATEHLLRWSLLKSMTCLCLSCFTNDLCIPVNMHGQASPGSMSFHCMIRDSCLPVKWSIVQLCGCRFLGI